jgi:carbonic anhydrase
VSPWKTPWDYKGARGTAHWSELDPGHAACNTGSKQSPISIRNPQKAELPALRFEYKSGTLSDLINNAHTIRVNRYDAPRSGNYLTEGDKCYQLTQLHFHRPSEEYINGKPYDMVVHLMRQAGDGKVAGVAVLLKRSDASPLVQKIWEHTQRTEGGVRN